MKFKLMAASMLATAALTMAMPAAAQPVDEKKVHTSIEVAKKDDSRKGKHGGPSMSFDERKQKLISHIAKDIAKKEKLKLCAMEAEDPKALHTCMKLSGDNKRGERKGPPHELKKEHMSAEGKGGPRHAGPRTAEASKPSESQLIR